MINFILKGLFRDKNRSFLPFLVVALGVMLTIFFHSWFKGVIGESIDLSAMFSTGHVKVMSKAYKDNESQIPNDLALTGTRELLTELQQIYPDIYWAPRIKFGGLADVPDSTGETRKQGPVMGMGIDLLSESTREIKRMKLNTSLVRGKLPSKRGDILLSEQFSQNLEVNPGDEITLLSSTMYGGMAIYNFTVSGTVKFGTSALDRGTIIADIEDVRDALNMQDATGELLGFFKSGYYDDEKAEELTQSFNARFTDPAEIFSPEMVTLRSQGNMEMLLNYMEKVTLILISVFVLAMSIVLWNAGLLSGIRRYGEVGLRLAMGEEKGHIYRSLILESVFIGLAGTIVGTLVGLGFAWLLQTHGINFGSAMQNTAMMFPSTFHARISSVDWYLGFVPGLFSTVLGTMLSGIGIYKRKTASLFRELDL